MTRDGERYCDGCGQKIPSGSKLSQQASEGNDLCLQCRIRKANEKWGR